jgi:Xaa-Pro aminopeptidase
VFPKGVPGGRLDIVARLPLYADGLDYRHGTGHGVGAFLNVHEGPHGIRFSFCLAVSVLYAMLKFIVCCYYQVLMFVVVSFRPYCLNTPLIPGMIVTNEPGRSILLYVRQTYFSHIYTIIGYYEDGAFGIRIENCMVNAIVFLFSTSLITTSTKQKGCC